MRMKRRQRWAYAPLMILSGLFILPFLWMFSVSLHDAQGVFAQPFRWIPPAPQWQNYADAAAAVPFGRYLLNTVVITGLSTLIALLLGVPAAYKLAFYPTKRSNFTLMWVMSTRMLPAVGVIVPLYIIFKTLKWFDTYHGLVVLYTAINLPLVIWMMRSFLQDLPYETIEAARIDGASLWQELMRVMLPMSLPGLVSTILLCLIFTWNEFFIAFNLTITKVPPLTVYIVGFKTSEGLFWAKMSAAATVSALPVVIAGWISQRQIVRGLTAGAIK